MKRKDGKVQDKAKINNGISAAAERLYKIVSEAAKNNEICPGAEILLEKHLAVSPSNVKKLFDELISAGLISVEHYGGHKRRIVTITATGQRTTRDPFGVSHKKTSGQDRVCLRCQNTFKSTWTGNRICGPCQNTAEWKSGDDGDDYRMVI